MSNGVQSPERKLSITLRLIGCSEGAMEIFDAMEIAGYTIPERKGVHRHFPAEPRDSSSDRAKRRRTSKQKQKHDTKRMRVNRTEHHAMKATTTAIIVSQKLPLGHKCKTSANKIVKEVNEYYKPNLTTKTTSMMVREGRIGVSPKRCGPEGILKNLVWQLLRGTFASFIKLEQANGKT